jgi:hypothetical protein
MPDAVTRCFPKALDAAAAFANCKKQNLRLQLSRGRDTRMAPEAWRRCSLTGDALLVQRAKTSVPGCDGVGAVG